MSKRKFFATPYLVWILGFTILPLVMIFWYAFGNGSGGFTIENVLAIFDGVHRKALVTTLVLALCSTAICLVIAFPLALVLRNMHFN